MTMYIEFSFGLVRPFFVFLWGESVTWLIFLMLFMISLFIFSLIFRNKFNSESSSDKIKCWIKIARLLILFCSIYVVTYIFSFFEKDIERFESNQIMPLSEWSIIFLYRLTYYLIPILCVHYFNRLYASAINVYRWIDSVFFVFTVLFIYRFCYSFFGLHHLFLSGFALMRNLELINSALVVFVLYYTANYKQNLPLPTNHKSSETLDITKRSDNSGGQT
jgi:hypothetical protein